MLTKFLDKLRRKPSGQFSSAGYWEGRYREGGTSGAGSYGLLADFKAEVLNRFVAEHAVTSVVEFGCGDGNQLTLARYPSYVGIDVSSVAIQLCRERFSDDPTKRFELQSGAQSSNPMAELALSLDVIYHLLEDEVFDAYMRRLFTSATRYVVIYSSNGPPCPGTATGRHVKHRKFTEWVEVNVTGWKASEVIPNRFPYDCATEQGSFADFFIYSK